METGLKGRSVLITGASRNLGRLSALEFAREGANLAICTSTRMKELNDVADKARALGATVVAEQCDVADCEDVSRFVRKAREALGGIDVAINLAVHRSEEKFLDESLEAWERTIAVNLNGPGNICRNVIPLMIERRWGRIINFSGITAYIGTSNLGVGAAKAMVKLGIVGFTRGIAREFGQFNITANCVSPGEIARDYSSTEQTKPPRPNKPIPREGRPEEVVSMLVYLASQNAGYITGQCYLVNGGTYFQ